MSELLWLWILLGLLALSVAILLCIPIVVTFRFDGSLDSAHVSYRYLFYQKQLFPKPKEDKPSPKRKQASSQKEKQQEKASFGSLVKTHGPVEAVSLMVESATALLNALKNLLKGAKIRHFHGVFAIGGEDAADAALKYGQVCAVLYPFLGMVSGLMTFVKPDLQVYCNYEQPSSVIQASGKIHISILRLPFAAGYALRYLIHKNLEKGGSQYERSKKRSQSTKG
ncbi:MAG: DUF2953 domain-containing protein [Clostridia bacterium]|nr:DUF2953 domain-containing protein [Clostridia bacterium]